MMNKGFILEDGVIISFDVEDGSFYFSENCKFCDKYNLVSFNTSASSEHTRKYVIAFLIDLVVRQEKLVIYVCSSQDNPNIARARLFESWFNEYSHFFPHIILKHFSFGEASEVIVGVIINTNFYNESEIEHDIYTNFNTIW